MLKASFDSQLKATVDLHYLVTMPGFFYIATPYSKFVGGRDKAWEAACKIRGLLMQAGISGYSPIAESHHVAKLCGLGTDHHTWSEDNETKMQASCGILVIKLPGWDQSAGIADEIARFRKMAKPILYLDVPLEVSA
jgi:hypothetical protein